MCLCLFECELFSGCLIKACMYVYRFNQDCSSLYAASVEGQIAHIVDRDAVSVMCTATRHRHQCDRFSSSIFDLHEQEGFFTLGMTFLFLSLPLSYLWSFTSFCLCIPLAVSVLCFFGSVMYLSTYTVCQLRAMLLGLKEVVRSIQYD